MNNYNAQNIAGLVKEMLQYTEQVREDSQNQYSLTLYNSLKVILSVCLHFMIYNNFKMNLSFM